MIETSIWHHTPWCPKGCNHIISADDFFIQLFGKYFLEMSHDGNYKVKCPICNNWIDMKVFDGMFLCE